MASSSSVADGRTGNLLLDLLSFSEKKVLLEGSKRVTLPVHHVVFNPGTPIDSVYFPISGVLSLLSLMGDGEQVEVATIGREGVAGIPAGLAQGVLPSARCVSQIDAEAIMVPLATIRERLDKSDELSRVVYGYTYALFSLVGQNAACNRLHRVDQRAAKWLLMTHDRVDADYFELTHEYLGQMLGVRRASVSEAMDDLRDKGAINYSRGRITIVHRETLEKVTCECYRVTKQAFDALLMPD